MSDILYADLTLDRALALFGESDEAKLQRILAARLSSVTTEQNIFKRTCDRFDELYYTTTFSKWGADLWADDPSATTPGRSHVSINTPSVYVDVPASLQSVDPVEDMHPTKDSDEGRHAANALERVRKTWKIAESWQVKRHKSATVKALYGRTASYIYWDTEDKRPHAKIVENPRNLYLGYKSDDHEALEWAARVELLDPMTCVERYSVVFSAKETPEGVIPWVLGTQVAEQPHMDLNFGPAKVEVWDYWYRQPATLGVRGKKTKMETWNVVVAGNEVVLGPIKYAEYEGAIPYIPLYNTYIPGTPTGRAELHDMEQLIREKYTRVTAGAQMIAKATAGDYWQLVGADSPKSVPPGAKPKLNDVITSGAGNRIEAIAPWVAEFQLEQFLGRLDRESATVSGLNDLLLGLAPAAVLNSSKAINALIANYESRISMRRLLFFSWDRATWELAVKVWIGRDKNGVVAKIMKKGGGTLEITDPSLSPKDEMETATRALNLVNGKLWAQARGMGAVGVDDAEQEQEIIRHERTDAIMFPADVQIMASLMSALQSLGMQAPAGVQNQIAGQQASGTEALRQALGGATPQGTVGSQGPGNQGVTPPIPGAPPEAGGAPPFIRTQPGAPGSPQANMTPQTQMQSTLQGGTVKNQILTRRPLGRR